MSYKANYYTAKGEQYDPAITGESIAALRRQVINEARQRTENGTASIWHVNTFDGRRVCGGIVFKSTEGKFSYTNFEREAITWEA